MRKKALFTIIAAAVVIAAVAIPVVAMAAPAPYAGTLKNNYGLEFAGQLKCLECHTVGYGETTHGMFSGSGALPSGHDTIYSVDGTSYDTDWTFVTLGYGTGLREFLQTFSNGDTLAGASVTATSYIGVVAGAESFWSVKAGGEQVLDKIEYAHEGGTVEYEAYCGGNCHNLGYTKMAPNANSKGTGSTSTWQGWATSWDPDVDSLTTQIDLRAVSTNGTWDAASPQVMYGAGIQCENCHGTGTGADVSEGGHWNSGVKINSTGSSLSEPNFRPSAEEARPLLRSDVCGQCHGSYQTSGTNLLGYTPDKSINLFTNQIGAAQIPTEEQFDADVAGFENDWLTWNGGNKRLTYRYLWPGGINSGYMYEKPDGSGTYSAGMKHSYFTEWSLTGHSFRARLTSSSPDATMYQKSTTMNGLGGGGLSFRNDRAYGCFKCHSGEAYLKLKNDPMATGWDETTATVGYLGVECSACHIVHNAETEKDGAVGMALRTPKPGNNSICEDCHKDRRPVMNDPVNYPIAPIHWDGLENWTRGLHAGQGLVLEGGGMYEVPSIQGPMSNVGCEKCHMPATRADFPNVGLTRYEDRSYKRYSHSMKIVEPGQFGAEPWQDSCSPCHPGETQEELVEYIEDMQAEQVVLFSEATAAVMAAKARVGYVAATTAVSANDTLFDRATNNIKVANLEGSGGFHNPEYNQAGLRKSIQLSKSIGGSFALVASSSSVSLGNLAYVAGKADGADGGTMVLLDGTTVVGTTTTDSNGNFAFTLSPTTTKSYRVKWMRCSDPIADLYSGYVTIAVSGAVVPPVPSGGASSITISTNMTSARRGSVAYLSGFALPTPGMIGRNMHVDVKKPNRTYWTYSSARTIYSANGVAKWMYKYTFVSTMALGTYQFKAVYDGPGYDPCMSGVISVVLR